MNNKCRSLISTLMYNACNSPGPAFRLLFSCCPVVFQLASPSQNSSKLWSEIIANAKLLIENSRWLIGDGTETNFWTDNWLQDKPLIEYATADPLCFPKI